MGSVISEKENRTLAVWSLNVNGLKKWTVYPDFVDFLSQFDIFYVEETHHGSFETADILWYIFGQSYKRKSGGIGIYVTGKLSPFIEISENDSEYILWIVIKIDIILGAIYLPRENSSFFNDDHFSKFENGIAQTARLSFTCT